MVSKTEARQGRQGKRVLYILIAATVLAAALWLVLEPLSNEDASTQIGSEPAIEEPVATE